MTTKDEQAVLDARKAGLHIIKTGSRFGVLDIDKTYNRIFALICAYYGMHVTRSKSGNMHLYFSLHKKLTITDSMAFECYSELWKLQTWCVKNDINLEMY